ncbi:MAG: flagellar hook-length control protein FliK [Pseudomonadota bacterium]
MDAIVQFFTAPAAPAPTKAGKAQPQPAEDGESFASALAREDSAKPEAPGKQDVKKTEDTQADTPPTEDESSAQNEVDDAATQTDAIAPSQENKTALPDQPIASDTAFAAAENQPDVSDDEADVVQAATETADESVSDQSPADPKPITLNAKETAASNDTQRPDEAIENSAVKVDEALDGDLGLNDATQVAEAAPETVTAAVIQTTIPVVTAEPIKQPLTQSIQQRAPKQPTPAEDTPIRSGIEDAATDVSPEIDADSDIKVAVRTATPQPSDAGTNGAADRNALLQSTSLPSQAPTSSDMPQAKPIPEVIVQVPQQRADLAAKHVGLEISRQALKSDTQFAIRMDPPELGKLDVKLTVSKSAEVQATIVVERESTFDLLTRDAKALERALQEAGLKTDQNSLQLSLKNQGFDQGEQNTGGTHGANGLAALDEAEDGETIDDVIAAQAMQHPATLRPVDIII